MLSKKLVIMKTIKFIFIVIMFVLASYVIFNIGKTYYTKINTVKLTIPEGYTDSQIGQALEKSGLVTQKDFVNEVQNWTDNSYWVLKGVPNDAHKLDGFLYPSTYSFSKKASSKTIINEMLKTFEKKMEPNKEYITKNNLNIRNIVITASLIEKEAGKNVDRPKISSVIYNRLNKNMPLQIDSTILYIIGHKNKLYNKDLAVQSPYNTYLHKGLPPSPICNPGISSINAAIHPAKTDYLYYVLNSKTNEHIFSKTYIDHMKNVSTYEK